MTLHVYHIEKGKTQDFDRVLWLLGACADEKVNQTMIMSVDHQRSAAENEFTRVLQILYDGEHGAYTLWREHVRTYASARVRHPSSATPPTLAAHTSGFSAEPRKPLKPIKASFSKASLFFHENNLLKPLKTYIVDVA